MIDLARRTMLADYFAANPNDPLQNSELGDLPTEWLQKVAGIEAFDYKFHVANFRQRLHQFMNIVWEDVLVFGLNQPGGIPFYKGEEKISTPAIKVMQGFMNLDSHAEFLTDDFYSAEEVVNDNMVDVPSMIRFDSDNEDNEYHNHPLYLNLSKIFRGTKLPWNGSYLNDDQKMLDTNVKSVTHALAVFNKASSVRKYWDSLDLEYLDNALTSHIISVVEHKTPAKS
jgi:hypothetical protein